MTTGAQTMTAARFKATCLDVLDRVKRTRRSLIITKRGRPVAKLVPLEEKENNAPLAGSIVFQGDLISPVDEAWNADQ